MRRFVRFCEGHWLEATKAQPQDRHEYVKGQMANNVGGLAHP
jgi:hypothetical protein